MDATRPVVCDGSPPLMAGHMTDTHDIAGLLCTLSEKLCEIAGCEILIYSFYDPAVASICNYVWKERKLSTEFCEASKTATPEAWVWDAPLPVLVQDVA